MGIKLKVKQTLFTASKYGRGVYFSTMTAYSHEYSKYQAGKGPYYMIRARVITGRYCLGEEGMICAPRIDENSGKQYDSVVNDVDNPSIFVVFRDAAAYPQHVVQYTVESVSEEGQDSPSARSSN